VGLTLFIILIPFYVACHHQVLVGQTNTTALCRAVSALFDFKYSVEP
jgi:hypothetical protein